MGDRKIPPKEIVANAIKKVLSSRKIVESQEELALLVGKELKKINKDYVVRPTRVKRIALEIREIEVKAKTRKSIGLQKIDKCPICGSEVKEMKIKNLLGKEIVVGYRCSKCGYESDLEAFLPMKYIFVWKY
jgi:predicted Zn-ribbon and HTH transcriptional regulator